MCGIIGAVAKRDVQAVLLEGLRRLEYRGYDSAGLAWQDGRGGLARVRVRGKVQDLLQALQPHAQTGNTGIAHTRWATHGAPTENNAHPHLSHDHVAVVHNGVIENHLALREKLTDAGYHFESDTDTETIAHLLHHALTQGHPPIHAIRRTVSQLVGAYSLGILLANQDQKAYIVRHHSPLIIGLGVEENFFASDELALLPVAEKVLHLRDGEIAEITCHSFTLFNEQHQVQTRDPVPISRSADHNDKQGYRHFMLKEIYEQPTALRHVLMDRITGADIIPQMIGSLCQDIDRHVRHIHIIACGTSAYAGMVAKYWFESLAGISVQVEIASEYRYREVVVPQACLLIAISQSGETADTLAAVRKAKNLGYHAILAICNVAGSALAREAEHVLLTQAGREIGVASTKAFTNQLTALLMVALVVRRAKGKLEAKLVQQLQQLPALTEAMLALEPQISELAHHLAHKQHCLYLGRGEHYPIALEGALKLKELSYIHAEAFPAGELKHGPLALVDEDMPVVAVAPNDALLSKLMANLETVQARGGQTIVLHDKHSTVHLSGRARHLALPSSPALISPILYTIPLQLLAYHVAVMKGTDVDQPRNLAKSVTVE